MKRMPEDVFDMYRMADVGRTYKRLSDVRAVQQQVAEWITEAAYARYGHTFDALTVEEILEKCWENAQEQWPGIASLAEALNAAERSQFRDAKPMA